MIVLHHYSRLSRVIGDFVVESEIDVSRRLVDLRTVRSYKKVHKYTVHVNLHCISSTLVHVRKTCFQPDIS